MKTNRTNSMGNTRRSALSHLLGSVLSGAALIAFGISGAHAQSTTVKVIVPYAPGGVSDQAARVLVSKMSQVLGQTMIVENRPGAGSRLGTLAVAQAPTDGSVLLFTNISYSTLSLVDPAARIDPIKSLTPVGLAATYGATLVVKQSLPVDSLAQLVAYARSHPGQLTYGSAGLGSGAHFVGEYFKKLTGTFIVHVPYRSTAAALNDVVSGQIDLTFDAAAKPLVDAGRVKALAIVGAQRDPRMPLVPTATEAGVKGLDFTAWLGLFAPAGASPALVDRLNKAMNTVLQDSAVRKQLEGMGLLPQGGGADRLTQQLRDDATLYRKVIDEARLKFDTD